MGQSACNAFAYSVWLRAVPMVLCSNDLQMEDRHGSRMTPEEIDWLALNVIDASLAPGQTWFFRPVGLSMIGADPSLSDGEDDDQHKRKPQPFLTGQLRPSVRLAAKQKIKEGGLDSRPVDILPFWLMLWNRG